MVNKAKGTEASHKEDSAEIPIDDPLFDETQACKFLGGPSPRTLQRWREFGDGPTFLKLGKLVRYRRSALEAFIANSQRGNTADRTQAA